MRAVLFDAGHTLLAMDYGVVTRELHARGHAVDEERVMDAERRARAQLDREQAAQPTRDRKGAGRYLQYILDRLGIMDPTERAAIAAWRRTFNLPIGLCHVADGQAVEALRRLRASGIVTGVISNSNGSAALALERAGLLPHLDFVIDSTVVGMAKPDPRVFHLGLAQAGVGAHEALYVGDSYFVDVRGARAAGMSAVLFDPGGVWEACDCPTAAGLDGAAELALG